MELNVTVVTKQPLEIEQTYPHKTYTDSELIVPTSDNEIIVWLDEYQFAHDKVVEQIVQKFLAVSLNFSVIYADYIKNGIVHYYPPYQRNQLINVHSPFAFVNKLDLSDVVQSHEAVFQHLLKEKTAIHIAKPLFTINHA